LFDCGDSAVDGDNELRPGVAELGEGFGVEAITFFDAVRDIEIAGSAQGADGVPEDGGGGDAVDVVVAVDNYFLFIPNGLRDAVGGLAQAGNQKRIGEGLEAGSEKVLAIAWFGDAAVDEDLGDERGDFQPGGQVLHGRVRWGDVPALRAVHPCVQWGIGFDLKSL